MIAESIAAFGAGAASSLGPCAAPRGIAVASLIGAPTRRKLAPLGAFVTGIASAYAALGYAAAQIARLTDLASWAYAILAIAFILGGLVTLFGAPAPCASCVPLPVPHRSLGGMFLLGASSTSIASPCCTPIVLAVASYANALGAPGYGALLLAIFALGHALPVALLGMSASAIPGLLRGPVPREAATVVGGNLLLILGIFYGCLI